MGACLLKGGMLSHATHANNGEFKSPWMIHDPWVAAAAAVVLPVAASVKSFASPSLYKTNTRGG